MRGFGGGGVIGGFFPLILFCVTGADPVDGNFAAKREEAGMGGHRCPRAAKRAAAISRTCGSESVCASRSSAAAPARSP